MRLSDASQRVLTKSATIGAGFVQCIVVPTRTNNGDSLSTTVRLQQAADWLSGQRDAMVATIARYCNQNSWSFDPVGLNAMADLLEADFAPLGLPCHRHVFPTWTSFSDDAQAIEHTTGPALLWHHQPVAARRLLLMIHYDTVYSPQSKPATVRQDNNGRLIGPGVADAKGGIAVIRFATEALLRFELCQDIGFSILLNPDEEVGSPASRDLFERLAPEFEYGLLFEPTLPDGSFVANRKGTGNFYFTIRGRAAHAGRNLAEGRSAIIHASRLAIELDDWNRLGDGISVNVGKLVGGGPLNQVPALATLAINVRVSTEAQSQTALDRLTELTARFCAAEGFDCQLQGGFHSPPKCVTGDQRAAAIQHHVTAAAKRAARSADWQDTGGSCDGNKLAAIGLANVDSLGVTGGQLHSPLEYCEIDSLTAAAATIVYLVAQMGTPS